MTIKSKIFGGFALMLALSMGLAWNGWHALGIFAASVDVTTSAQRLADRIHAVALAETVAVTGAGPVDFTAARNGLDAVRGLHADLAARLREAGDDGERTAADLGTLAAFADGMESRMTAYSALDGKRAMLVGALHEIANRFNAVSSAMVVAQDAQLKASDQAVTKARADQKAGAVALDLANELVEQVLRLRRAEMEATGGDLGALRKAFDGVRSTAGVVVPRLPPGSGPVDGGRVVLDAYAAALDAAAGVDARAALGEGSSGLLALADGLRMAVRNQQVGFESQASAAQEGLKNAIEQRNGAAAAQALTQEARAAQFALLVEPGDAAVAVIDAVAAKIEKSARELSYWIEDAASRSVVTDLRQRIKAHRAELPELTRTLSATRELARQLSAEAGEAAATADRIRDGQLALIAGERSSATRTLAAGALAALLFGIALSAVIGRGITVPLSRIVGCMRLLAQGDTGVAIPGRDRRDELRDVAEAVAVFRDNSRAMDGLVAEREETKQRAEQERRQVVAVLADSFEQTVGTVVNSVNEAAQSMRNVAIGLTATADRNRHEAKEACTGASEALSNSQTVASAAEELAASVAEIGTQVTRSVETAAQAAAQAARTTERFMELSRAGERIAEIIHLIKNIAEQTNLLALNATIEAARAGDAGRGFSVVAAEVKKLAGDTARASDEIDTQISAIQQATQSSAEAIGGITDVIDRVNESSAAIAAAIEQQEAVTRAIAESIHHVSVRTNTVSSNVAGVSEAAEKTGSAATAVLSTASGLVRDADALQRNVLDFLGRLRAG